MVILQAARLFGKPRSTSMRLDLQQLRADDFCHRSHKESSGQLQWGIKRRWSGCNHLTGLKLVEGREFTFQVWQVAMVTMRLSILRMPGACSRDRFRNTSSRPVPICDASSWLWAGSFTSIRSVFLWPSLCARRNDVIRAPRVLLYTGCVGAAEILLFLVDARVFSTAGVIQRSNSSFSTDLLVSWFYSHTVHFTVHILNEFSVTFLSLSVPKTLCAMEPLRLLVKTTEETGNP